MPITYVKGDASRPLGGGKKCIVHVVNDLGLWGRGFVMSLSGRWPHLRDDYVDWFRKRRPPLGSVLFSMADEDTVVANMVAQHGIYRSPGGVPPIRYDALMSCLSEVEERTRFNGVASFHAPRIGCGLAGGEWPVVEGIIIKEMGGGRPFTVYDLA